MIVVPCYEEEHRLQPPQLLILADAPGVRILFVDDGSRDRTPEILDALAGEHPAVISVLHLGRNRGKAEAVRSGLRAALDDGATFVAYYDADLSTPPDEMLRLVSILRDRQDLEVVLGARVSLLGRDVRRSAARHYLGRIFASIASLVLGLRVYDTQCGAKVFRDSPALRRATALPFGSRWAFDVELIGRLIAAGPGLEPVRAEQLLEVPLRRWEDLGGSKLGVRDMLASGLALARVRGQIRQAVRAPRPFGGDATAGAPLVERP